MNEDQPMPTENVNRWRAEIKTGELSDKFIDQLLTEVAQAKEGGRLVIPSNVGIMFDETLEPIFPSQVAILEPDEPELFDITKKDGKTRIVVNDPLDTESELQQSDRDKLASVLVDILSESPLPK